MDPSLYFSRMQGTLFYFAVLQEVLKPVKSSVFVLSSAAFPHLDQFHYSINIKISRQYVKNN